MRHAAEECHTHTHMFVRLARLVALFAFWDWLSALRVVWLGRAFLELRSPDGLQPVLREVRTEGRATRLGSVIVGSTLASQPVLPGRGRKAVVSACVCVCVECRVAAM